MRLRIDLVVAHGHDAAQAAVDVRIGLRGVVVILIRRVGVAVELIERSGGLAVGLVEAIERIAVERVADGLRRADLLLDVQRRGVIVVIVGLSAMPAHWSSSRRRAGRLRRGC